MSAWQRMIQMLNDLQIEKQTPVSNRTISWALIVSLCRKLGARGRVWKCHPENRRGDWAKSTPRNRKATVSVEILGKEHWLQEKLLEGHTRVRSWSQKGNPFGGGEGGTLWKSHRDEKDEERNLDSLRTQTSGWAHRSFSMFTLQTFCSADKRQCSWNLVNNSSLPTLFIKYKYVRSPFL